MTSRLHYGHFGRAGYDREEHQWKFQRRLGEQQTILIGTEAEEILPGTTWGVDQSRSENDFANLIKRNPELQPALGIIGDLVRELPVYEPAVQLPAPEGKLLAHGLAASTNGGVGFPVIAVPGGGNGEELRISASDGSQSCRWADNTEPIRQVQFAHSPDSNGNLLAVRLSTRTVIFRPTWHNHSVRTSVLDPKPVLSVPTAETGGFPHAHICFDCADQRRFVLIDTRGNWTAYQITGKHARSGLSYDVKRLYSGALTNGDQPSSSPEDPPEEALEELSLEERPVERGQTRLGIRDFSHPRCIWIQNVLLVAARRDLLVVPMRPDSNALALPLEDLKNGEEDIQILDVEYHPEANDTFFILTSRSILCMKLESDTVGLVSVEDAEQLIAWSHFRDRSDETLAITVAPTSLGVQIALYSRATPTITLFQCGPSATVQGFISSSDPVPLYLDGQASLRPHQYVMRDLLLQTDAAARDCDTHVIMLESSLRVCRSRVARQNASFLTSARKKAFEEAESDNESIENERLDPWTVPNQAIYLRLLSRYESRHTPRDTFESSAESVMEKLGAVAAGKDPDSSQCAGTLFEIGGSGILSTDIERSDVELQNLQSVLDPSRLLVLPTELNLERTGSSPIEGRDGPALSALSTYDFAVAKWISPAPRAAPSLSRKGWSDHANRMAVEDCLSSLVLQRPPLSHFPETQDQRASQATTAGAEYQWAQPETPSWSAPIISTEDSFTHSQPNTPNPYASQPGSLPDPLSPRPTPSLASGSSTSSAGPNPGDISYEQLSRWTVFSAPSQPLPARMSRTLAHWEIGNDPNEYSWSKTRRRIERNSEAALGRRAERHARKMLAKGRKDAAAASLKAAIDARAARAAPWQAEESGIRSSPMPSVRPFGTASQPDSGEPSQSQGQAMVVASQIERGAYGGRQPPPKRPRVGGLLTGKKQRKAGF